MLSTQVTTVLLAPMMFGLWALAEPAMLVLFGEQWAAAWPVLGLLALSKGLLTPCSTYIPYLKGIGQGTTLFWWAVIRAIATTAAVTYGAAGGSLVEAMVALCLVNLVTLVGYSWVVFRADRLPFFRGFLISVRPLISAFVMALVVRLLLQFYGGLLPGAVLKLLVGAAIGASIYLVLVLLTERPLLTKLRDMVRTRGASNSMPAAAE